MDRSSNAIEDTLLVEDSLTVQRTLDHLNSIGKMLEKLYDKVDARLHESKIGTTEKDVLYKGKEGIKSCREKLIYIRTKVENLINSGQNENNDLLRVITMKSDLDTESYECPICLVSVMKVDPIWSCSACYHILHLTCVQEHANSRLNDLGIRVANLSNSWNCPVCRSKKFIAPTALTYKCFCGAVSSPPVVVGFTAHSCGRQCKKTVHCTLNCHPAPCPKN